MGLAQQVLNGDDVMSLIPSSEEIREYVEDELLSLANERGDLVGFHEAQDRHRYLAWSHSKSELLVLEDHEFNFNRDYVRLALFDASVSSSEIDDAGIDNEDDESCKKFIKSTYEAKLADKKIFVVLENSSFHIKDKWEDDVRDVLENAVRAFNSNIS